MTPRCSVSKWLFFSRRWGMALYAHLNQHLQRSPREFPSARLCVHQRVPDTVELNFTAVSTSIHLLCIPAEGRHRPSCHYSLSIRREVRVGKKPIRWAGRRIIEVMIGAVQRQLIVMEMGARGARWAAPALRGLGQFQTRMWNNSQQTYCCSSERSQESF